LIEKQVANEIINQLENVKQRSQLWMDDDFPAIANFMYGFVAACRVLGVDFYGDYEGNLRKAAVEKGWQPPNYPLWDQMNDAGLPEAQIREEILAIYIEAWKKVRDSLPS
jgi:hypothetical protein